MCNESQFWLQYYHSVYRIRIIAIYFLDLISNFYLEINRRTEFYSHYLTLSTLITQKISHQYEQFLQTDAGTDHPLITQMWQVQNTKRMRNKNN